MYSMVMTPLLTLPVTDHQALEDQNIENFSLACLNLLQHKKLAQCAAQIHPYLEKNVDPKPE